MNGFYGFWDVIGTVFWVFAFVVYLIAVFAVIGDLFRDESLNGWWKALWVLALVFLPFITVLVYLVARGSGMRKRAEQAANDAQKATADYVRSLGVAHSPADEIAKSKALLDEGTITAEEYEKLRARALQWT
ncbi:SHOCT domain-containing protein [Salinibacterium sp. dk2585]|uniref:PLDc N-terminal domain-containing protein n=1 Tax=unclassified Salinibacterium TaxID=2632331 RepID=UPI0011C257DD|nr:MULTISPECIES: PLDc N-terminal domain-containing protein [unclassified Salinibacterium]QEE61029.1 SHOCT domain-containing protein [Salinibacterium sp. dk2585]TXK52971.1 SHOCT domain-containing protein [Salinibacterium sp. dk5596]